MAEDETVPHRVCTIEGCDAGFEHCEADGAPWPCGLEPAPGDFEPCEHHSESGDEGPVADLGRWPTRWRCDGCDRVRHDDPCLCDECKPGGIGEGSDDCA